MWIQEEVRGSNEAFEGGFSFHEMDIVWMKWTLLDNERLFEIKVIKWNYSLSLTYF